MDKLKVGSKLRCTNTLTNVFGQPLFIEGVIYEVLHIDKDGDITLGITLNHILYANEYTEFPQEVIDDNFIDIKQERKDKLNKLLKDAIKDAKTS